MQIVFLVLPYTIYLTPYTFFYYHLEETTLPT